MNKAELLIEQTISTDDPFTPTKLQSQPLVVDEEEEDFHKSQFLNFIGLIVFSISSALLWKYQIFGQTYFPWFAPAISIFVCVWAIHYWVSIAWDVKDKFKKQRYYFFLHATLSAILCLMLIISWTHESSSPWFIYPVGCLFMALALHWTYVWCPKEWRWIVSQMFIYCILITADFSLCYINSNSAVIWLWIAVIYGGILILQGFIYFVVTWMIPRIHKKKKKKKK